MSRLSEIPVAVEGAADAGRGLGGGTVAVLYEIAALLERLQLHGETGAVDLATMPMIPADYERLRSALGEGEVQVDVRSEGTARVRETGVHGVWWVEQRDASDRLLAEFLEITTVPEILRSHPADIAAGLERLRSQLQRDRGAVPGGDDHA